MALEYVNQTNEEIPAYLQAAGQQLVETVGGTYDLNGNLTTPGLMQDEYETYDTANPGIGRVTDRDQLQLNAYQSVAGGIGAYEPYMAQASAAANAGADFNTTLEDQGNIGQDARTAMQTGSGTGINSLSQFQNPYQQNVIDATTSEMNRQYDIESMKRNANAAKSGAFGGSRHGIMESEAARNHEANRTNAIAKLNQSGFDTATKNNESYLNRAIQGGQAMGNLGVNASQLNNETARTQASLGGLQQSYGINDINLQATFGDREQAYNQTVRDADIANFYENQQIPYTQAGFYSDIINGVPSSSSTMQTQIKPGPSTLTQGIGALGTYASVGNQFGWWGDD